MKREKGLIEFNNGIIISYWQGLSEIIKWRKFNWNTFQFINIEFENDSWIGAYEFTLVLFLCGIRIRLPHQTKKSKKFWKKTSKIMEKLDNSCYGWVNNKIYVKFKNKKQEFMRVERIRTKHSRKKIFIQ